MEHGFVDLVVARSWSEDVRFKIEYMERVSQSEETWVVELAISTLFFFFFLGGGGVHSQKEGYMLMMYVLEKSGFLSIHRYLEAWGLHV